jgi:hypothetical protein
VRVAAKDANIGHEGSKKAVATEGFILLAAAGCPTRRVLVASAGSASTLFERYRDHFGIGASDMTENCGNIYANDGTLVARVSYNGRVWSPKGELLQESEHNDSTPQFAVVTTTGGGV